MPKTHWNSIDLAGQVPDETIKAMLRSSYQLILQGLSKKRQKEIAELKTGEMIDECLANSRFN